MIRADVLSSPLLTQHTNNASHSLTYTYDDGSAMAAQNRDVMTGESSVDTDPDLTVIPLASNVAAFIEGMVKDAREEVEDDEGNG